MVNPNNFFDLYQVFVNELIGDVNLAIIIGLIIIIYVCIRMRMPFQVPMVFAVLWAAIMFAQTRIWGLWVFAVLFAGTIFYYYMNKVIR